MVTVTIDNQKIEVTEGTTVLNAAKDAGIHIPTLCDHPQLHPYGGCRLCMVEIDGFRTLQSACTIPVSNNMVVHTGTQKVKKARKFVLTLIFSERNHFCPYCQVSGGDCELQNAAYGEEMSHWPLQPNWQPYPVDASHPFFILEHNRCILCRRCIRACSELVGVNTLGVEERGAKTFVIADLNVPLGESTCVSCGTCVQVCPTGALIDRRSAYLGKERDVQRTSTICVGCSVGCGVDVISRDGQVIRIEGNWDAPVNDGILCKYGRFVPLTDDRERIKTPLVRKDGALVPTTWDEALDLVSDHAKSGNLAAAISSRVPAEGLFAFKQIFADGVNAAVVTGLEEGKHTLLASKAAAEIGQGFEGSLEDLKQAQAVLVFGANLVDEHQVAGFIVRRGLTEGNTLVVVDENPNTLFQFANCGLSPKAGTEVKLIEGLTAAAAKIGESKENFAGDPDPLVAAAAGETGLSSELLIEAAFRLAAAEKSAIVYDPANLKDVQALQALVKLAKTLGAALVDPKGGANSVAAAQYHLDQPFTIAPKSMAYIVLGDEVPTESLVKKAEQASFLVVQASHASRLTAMADVVLPAPNWFEQSGHFVNMDGRVQKAEPALTINGIVWPHQEIFAQLADRMGIAITPDWEAELAQRPSPVVITA